MRQFMIATLSVATLLVACEQPVDLAGGNAGSGAPGVVDESVNADLDPTLLLRNGARAGDIVTVELAYRPAQGDEGPRTAEIWLRHSEALELETGIAGEALVRADKQLIAQARDGQQVRLVVFSTTNLARLGDGTLAELRFRVVGDGPATVEILDRMPVFAPASANRGVMLPASSTVVGG